MSLIARCFDKNYILVDSPSIISDRQFTEIFDECKLATLLEDPAKLKAFRRSNARDQVPLEKYLKQFYQLRAGDLTCNKAVFKYARNEIIKTRMQSNRSSMQGMLREARHFIAHGLYTDVDMSNAHPRIILQLCDELKIKCKALKQYVSDRQQIFADWMALDPSLTRDDCKVAFIKILYGSKDAPAKKTPFVKAFIKEVPEIANKIMAKFPEYFAAATAIRLAKNENKVYNLKAAALSNLCQTFEASLLEEMFEILCENTNIVDSSKTILAFDGMMIANDCWDEDFTPEKFIELCHERINLPCFSLELKDMSVMHDKLVNLYKYKGPDEDIVYRVLVKDRNDMLNKYRNQKREGFTHEPQTYVRDFLEELRLMGTFDDSELLEAYLSANINKYFARLTLHPGMYACNISKDETPMQMIPDQNVSYYFKKLNSVMFERKSLAAYIKGSNVLNNIKLYNAARLHPFTTGKDPTPPGTLNTWTGFAGQLIEPVQCEITDLWFDHIKNVISAGDESMYDYMLTWLNHLFTKPNKVTRRCIVLYSEQQQIGKGLMSQLLGAIIGHKYYIQHDGLEFLKSNFNGEVEGKILNVCEELAALANDKTVSDTFKSLITDPIVNIKKKHQQPYNTQSYLNFMLISNNLRGVNISQEDERFCLYQVSPCRKGDHDYFNKLLESLDNPAVINNVYSRIVNFKPTRSVLDQPRSEVYFQAQERSLSSTARFFKEVSEIGDDEDDETYIELVSLCQKAPKEEDTARIVRKPFYDCYVKWAKSNGFKGIVNSTNFADELEKSKYATQRKIGGKYFADIKNPRLLGGSVDQLTLE